MLSFNLCFFLMLMRCGACSEMSSLWREKCVHVGCNLQPRHSRDDWKHLCIEGNQMVFIC